jgi:protein phosphatase
VSEVPLPAGGQIIGRRAEQQDFYASGIIRLKDGRCARLAVLADGMGGHTGGAIAARAAVTAFMASATGNRARTFMAVLEGGLAAANEAIALAIANGSGRAGMGATLVAAAVDNCMVHHISVGDSPLWQVSGTGLDRLNADHSMQPLLEAAVAAGEIDEETARPQYSALRSALTGGRIALVDRRSTELHPEDRLLMASDGLLSLGEPEVFAIMLQNEPAGQCAQVSALLAAVERLALPDQDNTTVMIAIPDVLGAITAGSRSFKQVAGWLAVLFGTLLAGAVAYVLLLTESPRGNLPAPTDPARSAGQPDEDKERAYRAGTPMPDPSVPAQSGVTVRPSRPVASPSTKLSAPPSPKAVSQPAQAIPATPKPSPAPARKEQKAATKSVTTTKGTKPVSTDKPTAKSTKVP